MEHKIGEIFEHKGEWYQCVEWTEPYCEHCNLKFMECNEKCDCEEREDGKNVIFKKLEKVGEPYESDGHLFQSYHTFEVPIFTENYATIREFGDNSKISIEIKQTKEDMEEYRMYDAKEDIPEFDKIIDECLFGEDKLNLKPFDLEAAKAGKPVCTREGRKARIICFDAKSSKPIIALVDVKGTEYVIPYFIDGRFLSIGKRNDTTDLMMLSEKKEGWVNVYKEDDSYTTSEEIYESKEEAIKSNPYEEAYLTTVKIEWEE